MSSDAPQQQQIPCLDVVVTGTETIREAHEVYDTLMLHAQRHPQLVVPGGVYYFCLNGSARARGETLGGVTELEWLLHNAARAKFTVHVAAEDVGSHVRARTFAQLEKVIRDFHPGMLSAAKGGKKQQGGGLERIAHDGQVHGIQGLYYRRQEHVIERKLRYMDGDFGPQKPSLALLVPITLKGWQDRGSVPFLDHLAPSLVSTLAATFFSIGIYLAVDDDEPAANDAEERRIHRRCQTLFRREPVYVRMPAGWQSGKSMAPAYNALFERAIMDGYDFCMQLADDTALHSPCWEKILGSFLCSNPMALGAYSLQDRFDGARTGLVMVSRTHYDVFGRMFDIDAPDPAAWIRTVYGGMCKTVGKAQCSNMIRGVRRRRNGTGHMLKNRGDAGPNAEPGRALFLELLRKFVAFP